MNFGALILNPVGLPLAGVTGGLLTGGAELIGGATLIIAGGGAEDIGGAAGVIGGPAGVMYWLSGVRLAIIFHGVNILPVNLNTIVEMCSGGVSCPLCAFSTA